MVGNVAFSTHQHSARSDYGTIGSARTTNDAIGIARKRQLDDILDTKIVSAPERFSTKCVHICLTPVKLRR